MKRGFLHHSAFRFPFWDKLFFWNHVLILYFNSQHMHFRQLVFKTAKNYTFWQVAWISETCSIYKTLTPSYYIRQHSPHNPMKKLTEVKCAQFECGFAEGNIFCYITAFFTQTTTSRLRWELLGENSKTYGEDCTMPMAAHFENKFRMCFWKDVRILQMCPTDSQYNICEWSSGREKFITLCKSRLCSNYNLQITRIQNFVSGMYLS